MLVWHQTLEKSNFLEINTGFGLARASGPIIVLGFPNVSSFALYGTGVGGSESWVVTEFTIIVMSIAVALGSSSPS